MTRRTVAASLAAGTLAGAGAHALAGAGPTAALPPGFAWGVAASAPQTEGRAGRGASIWDLFAQRPGAIAGGADLSVGTGFETRYPADLDLVARAGLGAFRFSIAWPRVQPDGVGPAAPAGLDFYDRLVDAMLARRLAPDPTLFHWDLPAALPGGWLNRDTASRFTDYATLVGKRLGDRVPCIMALNEPNVVAVLGHALGRHAPGLATRAAFAAAMHHQNLAQGLGIAALRSVVPRSVKLGTVISLQPSHPADPSPGSAEAARAWDDAWNLGFLDPLYGRPYPARFAADLAPLIRPGDVSRIAARPDVLGVNYYSRMHMVPAPGTVLGAMWGAAPAGTPATALMWPIEPNGLVEQLRTLREGYGNPEVLITETGAAFHDPAPKAGVVADPDRIAFLRDHVSAVRTAIAAGSTVRGLFAWTLTDNFEWAEGFGPTFGLVHVDRTSLARAPKTSLAWLGHCASANAILP